MLLCARMIMWFVGVVLVRYGDSWFDIDVWCVLWFGVCYCVARVVLLLCVLSMASGLRWCGMCCSVGCLTVLCEIVMWCYGVMLC